MHVARRANKIRIHISGMANHAKRWKGHDNIKMILREINKPGLDSWQSQRYSPPKILDSYLSPFTQGLQRFFLRHSRSLGIRLPTQIPFTADDKRAWSYASVPPAFLNGVDRSSVQYVVPRKLYSTQRLNREGRGVSGGNRMCLSFTYQLLIYCKSTRYHADGSGRASAVTNCSCAQCRYFIRQLHSLLQTASPR